MSEHPPSFTAAAALTDADLARLESLLDQVPQSLQPLDVSALDGFLCGVLLQPRRIPAPQWLPYVTDLEARPAPPGPLLEQLQALVLRRHAELDQAIAQRQWFDPWIYQMDDGQPGDDDDPGGDPRDAVLPWVAGFSAALEAFPALNQLDAPALVEPLALLFMHFDPEDLEDAEGLAAVIATLEPPADLAEAVQDVVRALMLIADVTRPRAARPAAAPRPRRGATPGAPRKGPPRRR